MDNVIAVDHLRKAYGDVVAVEDVSFAVRRGEIFGLLGPNGAGKTTTVESLQGLIPRDGGEVRVLGVDPARAPLQGRVGSQLQSAALPDRLRVGEAVRLFARLQGSGADPERVLAEWNLAGLRRRPFGALSGGQRQRLFLALAFLGKPEVVFLDELTTGLDPQARRVTWDLVRRVRDHGATVCLVTHLMEEAEALCDRVAIIDSGRVLAIDTPSALTAELGGDIRMTFSLEESDLRFLSSVEGVRRVARHDGSVTVTGPASSAPRVAASVLSAGHAPADFRTHYPTLEDVFLAVTGRNLRE